MSQFDDSGGAYYEAGVSQEFARQELDGQFILEDDAMYTAQPADGGSVSENHSSMVDDMNDPSLIYSILEEAIPKQQDQQQRGSLHDPKNGDKANTDSAAKQQQQRDILELAYERIRRWFWKHPTIESRQAAAYIRGQNDSTPLHLICKIHNPPADLVQALVESAPDILQWADTHGWLPLHHACAHGASPEVLRLLIQAFPAGKLQADHQRRTPLHFYATRNMDNIANMTANAELLADTGAAELRDGGGMLPMHYACAYGTHPAVLQVLAAAHPDSLTAVENHGRTPMHLAMVNAHRDASPGVIRFLLDQPTSKRTINARDQDGYLPMHLMALGLKGYKPDDPEKQSHVSACLEMYLAAEPVAAADFLTAIQDLPDWLQDTAVVSKHVRNILNEKIVQRFPTSFLMLDGIFQIILIVCFAFVTRSHIELRLADETDNTRMETSGMHAFLYVGAGYFLLRESVQIASLVSLGALSKYFWDPSNWLDVTVIVLVFYYAFVMSYFDYDANDDKDNEDYLNSFRTGVAVTQGILWVATIVYLKSTLVDFAVFVGGLFNVVQRLVAFLIAVSIILLAFAQMFYFVYVDTEICQEPNLTLAFEPEGDEYFDPDLVGCGFPHCTFEDSLLKVYTMMMGEIGNETRYNSELTAQILYVLYAFLVVILLSNVLIAIVTDSYEIIQNDRAAIVFWSNRLDFVAEMDAIAYAIQRRLKLADGHALAQQGTSTSNLTRPTAPPPESITGTSTVDLLNHTPRPPGLDRSHSMAGSITGGTTYYFREGWQQIMMLFDENLYDDVDWIETWVYNVFRIFCIFIVIPLWLTIGFVTAGWLWPPQVREYLFVQRETVISRSELERKKLERLKAIQSSLKNIKTEILREVANDRDDMIRVKSEIDTLQNEVLAELMQVREVMRSLIVQ